MKNYTIKLNAFDLTKLREFYKDSSQNNTSEYMVFRAQYPLGEVTAYRNSKNTDYKVVFSGENAFEEARIWSPSLTKDKDDVKKMPKVHQQTGWQYLQAHAGSDEVGFGDFFGPLVIAGVFLEKKDIALIDKYEIDDSKKMTDAWILSIGETLIRSLKCVYFTVDNEKLRDLTERGFNMNKIKAYLHNLALHQLQQKFPGKYPSFIDQFCTPKRFESYLEDQPRATNLVFQTKAESDFPAVAAASVIARYIFLKRIEQLNDKYGIHIPLGASSKVDNFAFSLAKTIGLDQVTPIVKTNFINYQRLLENLSRSPV